MIDREKVIKALELEIKHPYSWECAKECPYYGKTECDCYTQVSMDALELLKKPDAYEVLDGISSAYYGKQLYFLQDNGMIYDRKECDYVPFEEAFNRFVKMVGED